MNFRAPIMKTLSIFLTTTISMVLGVSSLTASAQQTEAHNTNHSYQSPGKPGAKTAINYKVSKERVAVGEAVQVYLSTSNIKQDVMARLQTTDNLLLSSNSHMTFKAGNLNQQTEEQVITVTPQTEGIHILTIYAKDLSVAYEKPIAIQIVAGSKPIQEYLEINGTVEKQDDGETVISMPAEEK